MKFQWTKTKIIVWASSSLLAFIIGVIYMLVTGIDFKKEEGIAFSYYTKYKHIKLNGKIIGKVTIDNDRYSLYTIKIDSCTVKQHDLRDSSCNYFLVIHGDTAKMVESGSYNIFINDSICITYEKKEMIIYRNKFMKAINSLPIFSEYYLKMQQLGESKMRQSDWQMQSD